MERHHPNIVKTARNAAVSPPAEAAVDAPLVGIEKLMADALIALDRQSAQLPADPGAIEYASWMRRLRRPTP